MELNLNHNDLVVLNAADRKPEEGRVFVIGQF
jgi:hypothetical protein